MISGSLIQNTFYSKIFPFFPTYLDISLPLKQNINTSEQCFIGAAWPHTIKLFLQHRIILMLFIYPTPSPQSGCDTRSKFQSRFLS